jgi:hypothetical protein
MRFTLLVALAAALAACGISADSGADSGTGMRDGGGHSGDGGTLIVLPDAGGSPTAADAGDNCAQGAKLVYVVDESNRFSSFDPKTLQFTDLGSLNCPAIGGATPFSMSVDRSAIAWVLYSNGSVFRVNTQGLACQATSFSSSAFVNFGMGFVSDAVGSNDETLFIAGGKTVSSGSNTLATIAFPGLSITTVGTITGSPELTGTGDAKLWGFFPNVSPPIVSQIDKTNGSSLVTYPAPSLQGTPRAWAFAFWGGHFWIFLERKSDTSTVVYDMDASDGSLTTAIPSTGRTIVGAGVSTCAPVVIN